MNLTQEFTKLRYIYNQFGETLVGIETIFGATGIPKQVKVSGSGGTSTVITMPKTPQKHRISAAGRKRISLAAKARWARNNVQVGRKVA